MTERTLRSLIGTVTVLGALLFFANLAVAGDGSCPQITPLIVDTAAGKIRIDGKLDDDLWQQAASDAGFKLANGKVPKSKTRLLIARDDKKLYLAIECFADQQVLSALKANITRHDDVEIWKDDDVEFFVDPTGKRKSYYQIIVNSVGTTCDSYRPWPGEMVPSWNPQYQSAAKVGDKSWTVELALPLTAFKFTKKFAGEWAFNVLCSRKGFKENVYWSPVGKGRPHQPRKFGILKGMPDMVNSAYLPPTSRVVKVENDVPGSGEATSATIKISRDPGPEQLTLLRSSDQVIPAEGIGGWLETNAATVKSVAGKLTAVFPAAEDAMVLYRLPRESAIAYSQPLLKISSDKCIWTGFKELVVELNNPGKENVKANLILEDLSTAIIRLFKRNPELWEKARQLWSRQLSATPLILKPGNNLIRISLDNKFRTIDDRRDINLNEIWGIGLQAENSKIIIDKILLDGGGNGPAGLAAIWPTEVIDVHPDGTYPMQRYQEMAKLGFSDPNATHSPFNGEQIRQQHVEPEEKQGALRFYPRSAAAVNASGGNGSIACDRISYYSQGLGVHFYGMNPWEARMFLFFDLAELPKGTRIKSAQLRLPNRDYAKKGIKGKPWWPPLQIYEVPDGYGDWDYDEQPTWLTQPPTGKMLAHGGLYRWRGNKVKCFSYDVTSFIRRELAGRKNSVGLSVRAMTSAPAWQNPHGLGHCVSFYGLAALNPDLAPYLYLELE